MRNRRRRTIFCKRRLYFTPRRKKFDRGCSAQSLSAARRTDREYIVSLGPSRPSPLRLASLLARSLCNADSAGGRADRQAGRAYRNLSSRSLSLSLSTHSREERRRRTDLARQLFELRTVRRPIEGGGEADSSRSALRPSVHPPRPAVLSYIASEISSVVLKIRKKGVPGFEGPSPIVICIWSRRGRVIHSAVLYHMRVLRRAFIELRFTRRRWRRRR